MAESLTPGAQRKATPPFIFRITNFHCFYRKIKFSKQVKSFFLTQRQTRACHLIIAFFSPSLQRKQVMSLFSDATLINADGSSASTPTITTGILFSSSWCPDCVPFVARLGEMYECLNEEEKKIEVVFVSSDRDASSMAAYIKAKHPDWLDVAYDDPIRNGLKRKFGCCAGSEAAALNVNPRKYGIPALVIAKPDGSIIKENGVPEVESFRGGDELPSAWQ